MHQSFVFLGLGILLQSGSLVLQKFALNHIVLKPWQGEHFIANFMTLAFNPWIVLSICGSFLSLGCWLIALTKLDISIAYPMVSLGYVITMIAGYYFFAETITPIKLVGVFLIVSGVYCLSRVAT